jgi:predicted PurR-regulated permease PerM
MILAIISLVVCFLVMMFVLYIQIGQIQDRLDRLFRQYEHINDKVLDRVPISPVTDETRTDAHFFKLNVN